MPAADSIMPLISSHIFGVRDSWMTLLIFIQFVAFGLPGAVGIALYLLMERRPSSVARTFSGIEVAPYIELPHHHHHRNDKDIRRAA